MLFFLSFLANVAAPATPAEETPCVVPATEVQAPIAIPCIEVSQSESLLDQEVIIQFTGLNPQEKILILAQTTDDNGIEWESFGLFQTNDQGEIDLSKQAPLQGSYQGTDAMGLLWSMEPPDCKIRTSFKINRDSFPITITAFREKEEIISRTITRLRKTPDVRKIPIRKNGLVGVLFLPPSKKPLPVIVTLNGSNGGLGENKAQLLASHGFAVLALGYFGVEGLPTNLQDIPLEYFETALAWLKTQPGIDGTRIGLYGISRGGELALILGSVFPHSIKAITAVVPSSVIHGALSSTPANAWTYRGKPLGSFAPVGQADLSEEKGKDPSHPVVTLPSFLQGMKDKEAFEAATIPVEKIRSPLLLISSGDDKMWPSGIYTANILKRLKEKNSRITCEHLHYPKAGHGITLPNLPQLGPVYYHPVGKRWFAVGGTPAADQYASQDSWKKLITFFEKTLKS